MSAVPSVFPIANAILFQARLHPHSPAVTVRGRLITYAGFAAHVERVTRRLAALAIPADARAAVVVGDEYLHWLVVIGLMRLGVASTSLNAERRAHDYARISFVLTDAAPVEGRPNAQVNESWYAEPADELPRHIDRPFAWDHPCRIVFSSGTTGVPKKIMLTCGMVRMRELGTTRTHGLNGNTRAFSAMRIESVGGFSTLLTCWVNGGHVVFAEPGEQPGRVVARARPNLILASVAQLGMLLDTLPEHFFPTEHTQVYVTGSALPAALGVRARARLSQSLYSIYGSTEAGLVTLAHAGTADTRPGFSGYVMPTAEIEIVDAQGNVRPAGEAGEVRMRVDGLATGYLDDPQASARAFRDGWFHSGDLGVLDNNGGLTVLGRIDELMNFGGTKMLPNRMEEALAGVEGVKDMAVFALERDGAQLPVPAIAVVADEEFSQEALVERFLRRFKQLDEPRILRVPAIPRNEMGKVLRAQLASQAREKP